MMPPTISKLLHLARQKSIDLLDAELIIAHVLKKPREFVIGHFDLKIERLKNLKIRRLLASRAKGVPLAYLLGHKEFYGLDFVVNKNVLIPRPETELIVDLVLSRITYHVTRNKKNVDNKKFQISNFKFQNTILIDVGTGSGCIPISVLANLPTCQLANLEIFATDISRSALKIAKQNAKKHHVKIKFLHGDLLKPFLKHLQHFQQLEQLQHLIITANLPYLTNEQYAKEPSIQHEPRLALVAKKNGLALYEKILKQIRKLLFTPYSLLFFLEIDPSQSSSIKLLTKHHLPQAKIKIHKDLARRNRVVEISTGL